MNYTRTRTQTHINARNAHCLCNTVTICSSKRQLHRQFSCLNDGFSMVSNNHFPLSLLYCFVKDLLSLDRMEIQNWYRVMLYRAIHFELKKYQLDLDQSQLIDHYYIMMMN